jgi:hypothetical protein
VRLFHYGKDGGPQSRVWAYFLIELKWLFTIVLLRFESGTRDAYHDHAFHSISWVLRGELEERRIGSRTQFRGAGVRYHRPSLLPIFTSRSNFHQVRSVGRTWVVSFRGPWKRTWHEFLPAEGRRVTLTHGRKEAA